MQDLKKFIENEIHHPEIDFFIWVKTQYWYNFFVSMLCTSENSPLVVVVALKFKTSLNKS
jgi:hypothetical protein